MNENHADISNSDDSENNYMPDDDISLTDSDLEKDVMAVMLKYQRVMIEKKLLPKQKKLDKQCVECKKVFCLECFNQTHSKKVN